MDKNEIIKRLKRLAKCAVHTVGEPPFVMSLDDGIAIHEAIDMLLSQPEQKKGKWIDDTYCSECGWVNQVESGFIGSVKGFNFCPNCGADMRGDGND